MTGQKPGAAGSALLILWIIVAVLVVTVLTLFVRLGTVTS